MTIYISEPSFIKRKGEVKRASIMITNGNTQALIDFGNLIGLKAQWRRNIGTHREHFLVIGYKVYQAKQLGAESINHNRVDKIIKRKKKEVERNHKQEIYNRLITRVIDSKLNQGV